MTDHWVANLVAPLALWVLANGIDDLFIDIVSLLGYFLAKISKDTTHRRPGESDLDSVPARHMAVFVAVWKEHKVIQRMIDNNVTRLNYPRCDFFVGAYPNDKLTIAAIEESMKRYPNVHLSLSPHDGPTSKADNLNWIFQRMLLYEQQHGVHFDMVLTHDAEDLMDPDALRWINYYAQWNDMVQIPVLALPTPFWNLTHGVYCDEFAEFQFKDMPARQLLGGFIPSNGVGTGFSRKALDTLARKYSNRIFEPACMTEDYENGFRIRSLGMAQKFIPIHRRDGRPIATREYFPLRFKMAIRQRTRWIMGITLQSWEYHSARETLRHLYWFWRDRRGLPGNLVTPLANLLFLAGLSTWTWSRATHRDWLLGRELSRFSAICIVGLCIQGLQTTIRAVCSGRIYGWRFACGVPLRVIVGNAINSIATARAIGIYVKAKYRGEPLRWLKTEHSYPNREALLTKRRRLGEILTGSQWITPEQLEAALSSRPAGLRLGKHLVNLGMITEQDLYRALSLQNNLPLGKPAAEIVSVQVTRALPAEIARRWRLLPFRIAGGELYVAGAELPGEEMQREIRGFSSLEVRFQLVTPGEYEELAAAYLT
ncbi:MAG: glycosyl transferase family protein [Acidobacteriota bacterium]|nr:glycosyl transferase family protein [Acidobacteriota bacterium]